MDDGKSKSTSAGELDAGKNKGVASYEVGYGRPPVGNRFKPGQSGNPNGRPKKQEAVNHPSHYGGADNPYEAIKVIEAWGLNFNLGNTVKYIARHELKDMLLVDLKKAAWYLNREIQNREKGK